MFFICLKTPPFLNRQFRLNRLSIPPYLDSGIGTEDTALSRPFITGGPECINRDTDYTVKKVSYFPVPGRDVTNQTIPCREKLNSILAREGLVSDIPSGDGKTANLFLQ